MSGLSNSFTGRQQIRIKKQMTQLPEITGRYYSDNPKDLWSSERLSINTRKMSEKSPASKNYFLPIESIFTPTARKKIQSPEPQRHSVKFRSAVNEQKLQQCDADLDQQEIAYKDILDYDTTAIESLFYSYCNFLEGLIQCVSDHNFIYKSYFSRAKTGFITIFRKIMPKLHKINSFPENKSTQTIMTINPTKNSVILAKLGDIINNELLSTDKLEKYIQKTFIESKRRSKINNSSTQTDYKLNAEGIIEYEFKSYENLQHEINLLRRQNSILIQEQKVFKENYRDLNDIDEVVNRNKTLESMIIEMRSAAKNEIEQAG